MEKRRCVVGLLAHVDAGKTTLAEAMLYCAGALRQLGRVDRGTAFLDCFALERERGITIFTKQAALELPELRASLLDTPGHMDFSPEMERALQVLDCAVLVLSASEGVQSHTRTLWRLLRQRQLPTLIFWNKMDLPNEGRAGLLRTLQQELGEGFFDPQSPDWESLATCDEALFEEYLSAGSLSQPSLCQGVAQGRLFPCWFGSAPHLEGVEDFLRGLERYAPAAPAGGDFGARVYRISRDERWGRLTHMKLTGGLLRPRDTLSGPGWKEKVTALYRCQGDKLLPIQQALPGELAAAAGLTRTAAGMGLGAERGADAPALEPVVSCQVLLPQGCDPHQAALCLEQLAEEEPTLSPQWDEDRGQLSVRLMGPVQVQILRRLLKDRFGLDAQFGPGRILYRETIETAVEGVGHFEPLGHYAEVHLLLEPGERGSGITLASTCPEDRLNRSWQRLIFTHLEEKTHLGVLTGSPLTDVRITLLDGRASLEHTEGGDFRQATWRAVRQGLMQARSLLLEPWYRFRLELPTAQSGRAVTQLLHLGAQIEEDTRGLETATLTGSAPVRTLEPYARTLSADTGGLGRLSLSLKGYAPCPEQDRLVEQLGYDPRGDLDNTPDSVFCSHGAGHVVPWDQVFRRMHLPSLLREEPEAQEQAARRYLARLASDEELLAIFERTYGPVRDRTRALTSPAQKEKVKKPRPAPAPTGQEYVLVDGYNVIFAWRELKELARTSLEDARTRLVERLRSYQGFRQCPVILVFDAYKVKGNPGSMEQLGGLTVVYTKEAETADTYIEKTAHAMGRGRRVRVVTSDGLEQIIILGSGALRVPASAFAAEVREVEAPISRLLAGPR